MCLQCVTNPWYYGSPFPGWYLIRARRSTWDKEMEVKDWGLLRCNDPDIIFNTTPFLYDEEDKLFNATDKFYDEMFCHPVIGYELITAFKQVPVLYRIKRLYVKYPVYSGRQLSTQLYIYLADFIANSTPFTEEDPFPNSDNDPMIMHDYEYDPKLP